MSVESVIIPLFPTPIYKTSLNITDRELQQVLLYVMSLEFTQNLDVDRYRDGFVSNNHAILESKKLHSLKKEIESEINFFAYEQLGISKSHKLKIIKSWATKHEFGDRAIRHNHANCLFSGILYLKTPDGSGNKIIFENTSASFTHPYFKFTLRENHLLNAQSWAVDVIEKDFVLFPSHVFHRVPVSQSKEDRYVIAFDVLGQVL